MTMINKTHKDITRYNNNSYNITNNTNHNIAVTKIEHHVDHDSNNNHHTNDIAVFVDSNVLNNQNYNIDHVNNDKYTNKNKNNENNKLTDDGMHTDIATQDTNNNVSYHYCIKHKLSTPTTATAASSYTMNTENSIKSFFQHQRQNEN